MLLVLMLAPPPRRLAAVLVAALAAAAALSIAGCGGPLSEAKADFKKGLYAEAKDELLRAEGDSHTWDDRRRAEYALYRGLTHGALGDRAAASLWLHEAKAIESAHPGTLSADDRARLNLALESTDPEELPAPP
jgi:hypothetical protein